MSNTILSILLIAAVCHAIWNALGKKVEEREAFFTLILGASVILYLPLAIFLLHTGDFAVKAYKWAIFSTISETLYFFALGKVYQSITLSNAYPILRGTAPIVATVLSLIFFGINVTLMGIAGIIIIICGILFINQQKLSITGALGMFKGNFHHLKWVFMAGSLSALSSVLDGMGAAQMSGILFKYFVFVGMFLGKLTIDRVTKLEVSYFPLVKKYPIPLIVGGLFVFISNASAVYAMETTPVTYVAAVREISIVFAALIGLIWLKEKINFVKWASIFIIVAGVMVVKFS
ncbi:DMT family transporter [Paenibacillus sp. BSR1-1]|uniref:DMT family transporter n=1 Tax=Paenibacillus sp. BSR1-1 TaxID=3020845 RepID=UPI0025AFC001|nr:DMT family transporter [Paenibacillus sp. BSR1-1]MDN3016924.1 DMT family transporter [Paenibacillus sp. BSR1-1]